ncbi:MAG: glycerate kinase [Solirubrobacterales bacterium]
MRVLVAPDSFKGTFPAREVADRIAAGLESTGIEADRCPIADGGEGTLDVLVHGAGGEVFTANVSGPLGDPVEARYAVLASGDTAVVEAAEAVGLGLVEPSEETADRATSRGVGELIVAAARTSHRVLVAVGGTGSTDGGRGAVDAVREGGGIEGRELVVLCDVTTPFEDAARVFAAQKGAGSDLVGRLDRRLDRLADTLPLDPRGRPGTGAGGGLAGGLWAALDARLAPGADRVLEAIGFDPRLRGARAAVVGEGRLDSQTEAGKAVAVAARWARRAEVRVDAIVGRSEIPIAALGRLGLSSVREASSAEEIEAAARELGLELLD